MVQKHLKRHVHSFQYAGRGFKHVLSGEVNIWVHIIATVVVLLLAYELNFSLDRFLILILTIGLVITTELLNTAIEEVVNFISPDQHPAAALIKDIAAAAVLAASLTAATIGAILFVPLILARIY